MHHKKLTGSLSVRFLHGYLSISQLQRTAASLPSSRNVRTAAFVTIGPSTKPLRDMGLVVGVSHTQKGPLFQGGDSLNVDKALTRIRQAKARLIRSGFKHLIFFSNLVAGVGFEPATFRL